MSKLTYIAHYDADNLNEEFETFEEAKEWLENLWQEDGDGFADETINGQDYIAKKEYFSKYVIIDKKENYTVRDGDRLLNKDGDEWTSDGDTIGEIELVKNE